MRTDTMGMTIHLPTGQSIDVTGSLIDVQRVSGDWLPSRNGIARLADGDMDPKTRICAPRPTSRDGQLILLATGHWQTSSGQW